MTAPPKVLIHWGDASHWGLAQVRLDDTAELDSMCRPVQMETIGWLVHENATGYLVAQEYQDADRIPTAREMVCIPKPVKALIRLGPVEEK